MDVTIKNVDQGQLDFEVGIKRLSVRDLLQVYAFEEITMYTPSNPEVFKGIMQPEGVIVLVDGKQVQSLDEIVGVRDSPSIEVVKVVQL